MLFAPTCAVTALPLVWCVTPNGHNSVELLAGNGCHATSLGVSRVSSEEGVFCGQINSKCGDCVDWALSQPSRFPAELVPVVPPSLDGAALALLPGLYEYKSEEQALACAMALDSVSNQLSQLRTVVLLI
jgi:hypothetical protein